MLTTIAPPACTWDPSVNGSIPTPLERSILCHLAKGCGGNILEIGCHYGGTTQAVAESVPEKIVYAVDYVSTTPTMAPEQCHEMPHSDEGIGHHAKHLANARIMQMNSFDLQYSDFNNIRMVFIDGDHSYKGVKTDSEKAMAHFNSTGGGLILWHDYYDTDPTNDWVGVKGYLHAELADHLPLYHLDTTWLVALPIGTSYQAMFTDSATWGHP